MSIFSSSIMAFYIYILEITHGSAARVNASDRNRKFKCIFLSKINALYHKIFHAQFVFIVLVQF